MAWCTIRLELARNPDFPDGSRHHGYLLHAPLDGESRLDLAEFEAARGRAFVEEFWGEAEPKRGHLVHRSRNLWCFAFDKNCEEPIFNFGDHAFAPGEYLTVRDLSGVNLTFRVASVVQPTAGTRDEGR